MDAVKAQPLQERLETMSLRDRIKAQWNRLSPSERLVARHLLDTHPQAVFETVQEVAAGAKTSPRSVVRLVQRLHYQGYPELQAELRSGIERRLSSPISRLNLMPEAGRSEELNQMLERIAANLGLLTTLDATAIESAASLIADSDGRVALFGGGKALALATYMWFELILLRDRCVMLSGQELEVVDQCMDLRANDVVILFEFRRYPRLGAHVGSMALQAGARLIVVSDSDMSPSALKTPHTFVVRTDSASVFDSYTAGFAWVDLLAHACELKLPNQKLRDRLAAYESASDAAGAFIQQAEDEHG
jgi:DNA-binding MurR/RpiR family transcriptional regulator